MLHCGFTQTQRPQLPPEKRAGYDSLVHERRQLPRSLRKARITLNLMSQTSCITSSTPGPHCCIGGSLRISGDGFNATINSHILAGGTIEGFICQAAEIKNA
jgi:hypothetical protein